MWPFSVGSMAPPPSSTSTLQTPQLPLPPQADGMKIFVRGQDPEESGAGIHLQRLVGIVVDPLMLTSPAATKYLRATIKTNSPATR